MNHELQTKRVLIVEDSESKISMSMNTAITRLMDELADKEIASERIFSGEEALPIVSNDMDFDCFLVATDMDLDKQEEHITLSLLNRIRCRQSEVPVFLMADREKTSRKLNSKIMELANEFVWILEDSPRFIAGRIEAAIARYRNGLLPPLMKAIWEYNENYHEYSWAAPGHQGGTGFTKTPAGKKFYDFYGENLFRTDTGIERSSIGSLLDHEGAFEKSETFAAKVFGADRSYSVVVGTSGSNRTIMQAVLTDSDIAVCDRNCHKSIEQGLILSGAKPVYMLPTRNRYGIIGPVRKSEMTPAAINQKIQESPIIRNRTKKPAYAVLTNCTYDGICYNAAAVQKELEQSVDHLHFDEAWYAYARFNRMYRDHHAMRGDPKLHHGPTVYATHSTHKLLNALSQSSYIHVRKGRNYVDFDRFNQAYMMQSTTSPLYAICASNDISAKMMDECGCSLTREVIEEAVDFRQALARLEREFKQKDSWFFTPWNPPEVFDPDTGKKYAFADAPRELLVKEQECWRLNPGETWHGFPDLDQEWVMLDPIKVSILAPGMNDDGTLQKHGVPAALVSYYLYQEGIVPTRTTDFQIMFLFSMGITKGKWGTLLNVLLKFREFYDLNAPVADVLPGLAEQFPEYYADTGLRDLGDEMFEYLRKENPGALLNKAFETLPEPVISPREAYMKIVSGQVEFVTSDELAGRITANSIIPYPPGIPMMMSGERFGTSKSPQIAYLHALESWGEHFPGFEHVTEGTRVVDGKYQVMCVKE